MIRTIFEIVLHINATPDVYVRFLLSISLSGALLLLCVRINIIARFWCTWYLAHTQKKNPHLVDVLESHEAHVQHNIIALEVALARHAQDKRSM